MRLLTTGNNRCRPYGQCTSALVSRVSPTQSRRALIMRPDASTDREGLERGI